MNKSVLWKNGRGKLKANALQSSGAAGIGTDLRADVGGCTGVFTSDAFLRHSPA